METSIQMSETSEPYQEISLERLRQGDPTEFTRLVEQTSPAVYRLALRILDDPHDAEDALQNTYINALRALPGFEGRSSLSTWLHRIAVNEALMLLRKRRPNVPIAEEAEDEDADQPVGLQIVDWCCLPESEMVSAETRGFVNQAIESLPEKLREVLTLHGKTLGHLRPDVEITVVNNPQFLAIVDPICEITAACVHCGPRVEMVLEKGSTT